MIVPEQGHTKEPFPPPEGITEAVQMYIPGNKVYRTIQARRARTGTLFILPLIIGFLLFMVRPLYLSFLMSLSKVVVVE